MSSFYLISNEQVLRSLDMLSVIKQVEKAYVLKAKNQAGVFPVIAHEWIKGTKDMDIKAGYIDGDVNIYGLKALTYIEDNAQSGLPALMGTMMLFDSNTGFLKGILDSRGITGYRTGAAGGIGSKYLARKDSETLMIVGAGNQAFFNLAANLLTMENIKRVMIYDPTDPNKAETFANDVKERLKSEIFGHYKDDALLKRLDISYEAVTSPEEKVPYADIIVTVTPSRNPLIKKEWLKKGVHINCVGADLEGKEELDPNIFADARVFADDIKQAVLLGESEIPVKTGVIKEDQIIGEIGDIINGQTKGRITAEDITLFDITGLALQDLVTAEYLLEIAERDKLQQYKL